MGIQARVRLPAIPLIGWREKAGGKPLRRRVRAVIDNKFGGKRRPVVADEITGHKSANHGQLVV